MLLVFMIASFAFTIAQAVELGTSPNATVITDDTSPSPGQNVALALLSKVTVSGVEQSTTDPTSVIHIQVELKNMNIRSMNGVMVSVNDLSVNTFSLTKSFGPFKADLDANGTGKVAFDLLASPEILSGNYPVTLTLTYVDSNGFIASVNRSISVRIDSKPVISMTPIVIVSSYKVNESMLNVGEMFALTFVLQNTSKTQNLTNMLVNLTSDLNAFTPLTGSSSQIFVGDIASGGSCTVVANLCANNSLSTGTYAINIGMQYQDTYKNTYNSTATISIPVRGVYTSPAVAPQVILNSYNIDTPRVLNGKEFTLSVALKNVSSAAANNVLLSFTSESNAFSSDSGAPNQIFVGDIQAGGSYTGKIKLKPTMI